MNMAQVLASRAPNYQSKPAIIFETKPYTFQKVFTEAKIAARVLQNLGVGKGDRVAIQLPKSMDFIFTYLANLSIGAITLPLNTAYKSEEVEYFLNDSGSLFFITYKKNYVSLKNVLDKIPGLTCMLIDGKAQETFDYRTEKQKKTDRYEPGYPTQGNDTAIICYTSGTTGQPKGAMITHANLIENTNSLNQAWQWTDEDILLHVLPIFHVHGLNVALLGGLFAGSTIIMHEGFEPMRTWQTLEEYRCTMLMGVPTMYHRLLNQWEGLEKKPDIRSMRVFISGSAPLSENIFHRFEKLVGHRILERYGMSEAGMITTNPIEEKERKPGSVGFPFPGVRVRIIDEYGSDAEPGKIGEICIQGNNVFKGYWQKPLETTEAFKGAWLKSGDLGYLDPNDGMRLFIVGRSKELIITGGYNVYPKEVESIIDQYNGVQESAVIGLPDDDFGEKVAAVVVLKKNTPKIEAEQITVFCKKRLASYKCPKLLSFRDELPRNAMGKIQKQILKEEYVTGETDQHNS